MLKNKSVTFLRKIADVSFRPLIQLIISENTLETIASQKITSLTKTYIPWSKASLSHVGMATILNDISINQRNVIVELGSGISTVYIAKFLQQQRQGHLFSVEQDADWLKIVSKIIERENVGEYVTFVHAPLTHSSRTITPNGQWYDESVLTKEIPSSIDMLIVDGPSDFIESPDPYIRYPALSFFLGSFSQECSVFLDDTTRKGEIKVLSMWEKIFDTTFRRSGKISFAFKGRYYKPFL